MSESFKTIDLNSTLDDIDDLPAFVVPLPGAYKLRQTITDKKVGEHPAFNVDFTILEVIEVPEVPAGESLPKVGDTFNIAFMRDNEFGAGKFKEYVTPIAAKLGLRNIAEIIAQSANMEIHAIVSRRADKTDKSKFYPDIKKVILE